MNTKWYVNGDVCEYDSLKELVESFDGINESDRNEFDGAMIIGHDEENEIYYYYRLEYDSEGHSSAREARKPMYMNENVLSKEQLIEFVKDHDFAYVWGAGIMYANEPDERDGIAEMIDEDGIRVNKIGDIYEQGCGCSELEDEVMNGCDVYKIDKWNEEPMFIAYYED